MPDPTIESELMRRALQEPTTSKEALGMLVSGLSEATEPRTPIARLLKALGSDPIRGLGGSLPLKIKGWEGQAEASLPWSEGPEANVSLEHGIPKGSLQIEGGRNPYEGWLARMTGRVGWGK